MLLLRPALSLHLGMGDVDSHQAMREDSVQPVKEACWQTSWRVNV